NHIVFPNEEITGIKLCLDMLREIEGGKTLGDLYMLIRKFPQEGGTNSALTWAENTVRHYNEAGKNVNIIFLTNLDITVPAEEMIKKISNFVERDRKNQIIDQQRVLFVRSNKAAIQHY